MVTRTPSTAEERETTRRRILELGGVSILVATTGCLGIGETEQPPSSDQTATDTEATVGAMAESTTTTTHTSTQADETRTERQTTTDEESGPKSSGKLQIVDSGLYRNGTKPEPGEGRNSIDDGIGLLARLKNGGDKPSQVTLVASINGSKEVLDDEAWEIGEIGAGEVKEALFIFYSPHLYTSEDVVDYQLVAEVGESGRIKQEVVAEESVKNPLPTPIEVDPESIAIHEIEPIGAKYEMVVSNNTQFDIGAFVEVNTGVINTVPIGPIEAGATNVSVEYEDENYNYEAGAESAELESVRVWSSSGGVVEL